MEDEEEERSQDEEGNRFFQVLDSIRARVLMMTFESGGECGGEEPPG